MHIRTVLSLITVIAAAVMAPLSSEAQWVKSTRSGNIAYFLFGTSPRLERFVLTNGQWLPTITLPTVYGPATALAVDNDTIYVAYGQSAKRYGLTGNNEVHLINAANSIHGIFVDGGVILLNHSVSLYARFTSISKANNALIAQFENYIDALDGASIAPGLNKVFGRSIGISPADITYVTYNDNGTFVTGGDSPHHGDYPYATRTWVFPGEARVVDDSGTVYSTGNLSFLNSFGGPITDLDFYGTNIPIVLRGSQLIAYSSALLPSGSHTLSTSPKNIYVTGTNVLAFTWDSTQSNSIGVETVPLSALNPPVPGQPVDPNGLAYTPDAAFLDGNGVLYLLSKSHQSLFRWSLSSQTYLTTIPLLESPSYVAYSGPNHTVYMAYSSGLIRQIDLSTTNFAEVPFVNLPMPPLGLSTAGPYVFAVDESGAWVTHYTFNAAGETVDSVDWNYYSTEYIWNEARQKMYYFRDDTSPNDVLWEEINENGIAYPAEPPGGIGADLDSPLHTSEGFSHPIRVSPDGTVVVLGSGVIHDATTLARLATTLGNTITDAAWVDGQLRTIRNISGVAQLQQWTAPNYGLGNVRQLPGTAHRLLESGPGRLLATVLQGGVPSFYVLDGSFNIIAPAVLAAPTGVQAAIISPTQVNLVWNDVAGEESYSIERKTGPGGAWQPIGTATVGSTSYSDGSVTTGNQYFYRIVAKNGTRSSAPSAEVSVAVAIPSAPSNLIATKQSSTSIRLTWSDVEFEAIYSVEVRVGTGGAWTHIATLPANSVGYTNIGLAPNTQYFYRLSAGNGIGTSGYSVVADATTDPSPPTTPILSSASATGPYSVALNWSNSSYEDGYVLERRSTAGLWGTVTNLPWDTTFFVDTTVMPVTSYEYRLYATNSVGTSPASNVRSVTTPQIPPPPAPSGLVARAASRSSIRVSWSDTLVEAGYRLERRTENPNSWALVAILPANTSSHVDTGLSEGLQYWYRVLAYNQFGASPYSNEGAATPANIVNLLADDFDPNYDSLVWADVSAGVATNGGAGFRGSGALHFGGAGVRSATTIPINVSNGGYLDFYFRFGNQTVDGNDFWNNSESGESVVLEYSRDSGANWVPIALLDWANASLSAWSGQSVAVPAGAYGPATQFRWRQLANSGPALDTWALEDFTLLGNAPAPPAPVPFVISSPSSSTSVAIYWAESSSASSYVVERKAGTSAWTPVATTTLFANYYTDTGLVPQSAYTYRIKAVNAGGSAAYSPLTISVTWSQIEQWAYDSFGTPEEISPAAMTTANPDGSLPLLRFAFNLTATEDMHPLLGSPPSGYPILWVNGANQRLTVEFIRRKAAMKPGITYQVQFSSDLAAWTTSGNLVSTTPVDSIWERVRYEDSSTTVQSQMRFGRVAVSVP